eukprot:309378-Rhodomonas_salina.3
MSRKLQEQRAAEFVVFEKDVEDNKARLKCVRMPTAQQRCHTIRCRAQLVSQTHLPAPLLALSCRAFNFIKMTTHYEGSLVGPSDANKARYSIFLGVREAMLDADAAHGAARVRQRWK